MILEERSIIDSTIKLMEILQQVNFDGGGDNNENNNNSNFSLCLIINKMIMLYQLDYYFDFNHLINQINNLDNTYSIANIYFLLYKYFIKIDMMIQRNLYYEANDEINNIKNLIENIKENAKNNSNNKKKVEIIIPKDIIFDYKNINNLFKLYQIYLNSLTTEKKK